MIDWTRNTSDPNDHNAQAEVSTYLLSIRVLEPRRYMDWLLDRVNGKSCLDIGAVEHDLSYTEKPTWKHSQLAQVCSRVVGVDILAEYVEVLRRKGFDIRFCDATSDADLGERFEKVVIGDVIEHVENPVSLLRFALRHLAPEGEVIVKTPNPYYTDHIKKFIKNRNFVNLEHLAWFTPTQTLELARRANCDLSAYVVDVVERPWYLRFVNPEVFSRDYVYIFKKSA